MFYVSLQVLTTLTVVLLLQQALLLNGFLTNTQQKTMKVSKLLPIDRLKSITFRTITITRTPTMSISTDLKNDMKLMGMTKSQDLEIVKYESQQLKFIEKTLEESDDTLMYIIAAAVPIISFLTLDDAIALVRKFVYLISSQSWLPADGGKYQAEILTPTLNGIVLPTISISLGTLVAGTISSLRDRLNTLRTCLNKESFDIRMLHSGKSVVLFMTLNTL